MPGQECALVLLSCHGFAACLAGINFVAKISILVFDRRPPPFAPAGICPHVSTVRIRKCVNVEE